MSIVKNCFRYSRVIFTSYSLLHRICFCSLFSTDGIELKEVSVLPIPQKVNLKAVEEKLGQLVQEVIKLQEQLTTVSSHANGTFRSGQNTTRT